MCNFEWHKFFKSYTLLYVIVDPLYRYKYKMCIILCVYFCVQAVEGDKRSWEAAVALNHC